MMYKTPVFLVTLLILCLGFATAPVLAGDEEGEKPGARYMPLQPEIIVNLSGEDGFPHYLKVGINLYVLSRIEANRVDTHMPMIRDRLIHYFGGLDVKAVSDVAQREDLRFGALQMLQKALLLRTSSVTISNLFFSDFQTQ